jgi:hypothetical protein
VAVLDEAAGGIAAESVVGAGDEDGRHAGRRYAAPPTPQPTGDSEPPPP